MEIEMYKQDVIGRPEKETIFKTWE